MSRCRCQSRHLARNRAIAPICSGPCSRLQRGRRTVHLQSKPTLAVQMALPRCGSPWPPGSCNSPRNRQVPVKSACNPPVRLPPLGLHNNNSQLGNWCRGVLQVHTKLDTDFECTEPSVSLVGCPIACRFDLFVWWRSFMENLLAVSS